MSKLLIFSKVVSDLTASAALAVVPCAGATQVNITVKEGGNKLLQIQDNGHGIQVRRHTLACHTKQSWT